MLIFKRIFSGITTIFVISVLVFFMFQIIPGDPVLSQLGAEGIEDNPVLAEKFRKEFNLDDPVPIRYKNWIKSVKL